MVPIAFAYTEVWVVCFKVFCSQEGTGWYKLKYTNVEFQRIGSVFFRVSMFFF